MSQYEEELDDNEEILEPEVEGLTYNNRTYQQFVHECEQAGLEVRDYHGRNFYEGPAVSVDDFDGMVEVMRATTVRIQYDQLGRSGYIIYPK